MPPKARVILTWVVFHVALVAGLYLLYVARPSAATLRRAAHFEYQGF